MYNMNINILLDKLKRFKFQRYTFMFFVEISNAEISLNNSDKMSKFVILFNCLGKPQLYIITKKVKKKKVFLIIIEQ